MKELKQLFTEAFQEAKQDPTEFFGSLAVLTMIFTLFYVAIWVVCPC
jgi:hypothetical protein